MFGHRKTHELELELAQRMATILLAHDMRITKLEKQITTNKKKPTKKARR